MILRSRNVVTIPSKKEELLKSNQKSSGHTLMQFTTTRSTIGTYVSEKPLYVCGSTSKLSIFGLIHGSKVKGTNQPISCRFASETPSETGTTKRSRTKLNEKMTKENLNTIFFVLKMKRETI